MTETAALAKPSGTGPALVCIGECMVEFHRADDVNWRQGFAGDTLNVAWAARALMPPEQGVGYMTRVGVDRFSDTLMAFLAAHGIATGAIRRDPQRTLGLYTIETDAAGERSFSYWRGQSAARLLADDPADLAAAVAGARAVYFSGITLAILSPAGRDRLLAALGPRDGRQFRAVFDPNIRPRLWEDPATLREAVMAAAACADVLLPTFDDEALAFGDATPEATLARYAAAGCREIVVKNGTRPTLASLDGRHSSWPVAPAPAVVDTTGAGDSFNGAYVAARLAGAGQPEAVRQAQAVAAAVVGQRGALIGEAEIRDAAASAP